MIKLYYPILFMILYQSCKPEPHISISPSSNVTLGSTAKINCTLRSTETVIWMHNNKRVGYNTQYFQGSGVQIILEGKSFILTLSKVSTSHSGVWNCSDGVQRLSVNLFVMVPWNFKSPKVIKLPSPRQAMREINSEVNNRIINNDTLETGQKQYPYELLNNESLKFTCQSECGQPAAQYIDIKYANSTKIGRIVKGTRQYKTKCQKGLAMMTNEVEINCYKHSLYGKLKITCESTSVQGSLVSTQDLYIQCPGNRDFSGLTTGEIVAIIIAIFLAIIDTVIIVCLVRRNYHLHNRSLSQQNYQHTPHLNHFIKTHSSRSEKTVPSEVML